MLPDETGHANYDQHDRKSQCDCWTQRDHQDQVVIKILPSEWVPAGPIRIFQLKKSVCYPSQTQDHMNRHDTVVEVVDVARAPGFATIECDTNRHDDCQYHQCVDRRKSRKG